MAESPEIPEAKDSYEKRVAITIAILAVILSLVSNLGDNAKTSAIIKTNEATNTWGYFQSKSIKEHVATSDTDVILALAADPSSKQVTAMVAKLKDDQARYAKEKDEIKAHAEALVKEAHAGELVNDRADLASLIMQIAIVLCSVAILSQWRLFWWTGMAVGAAGVVTGITAFLL